MWCYFQKGDKWGNKMLLLLLYNQCRYCFFFTTFRPKGGEEETTQKLSRWRQKVRNELKNNSHMSFVVLNLVHYMMSFTFFVFLWVSFVFL